MSDPDTPAPITPAQRAELARLCEAATAGPWISSVSPDEGLYNVLLAPDPDPPKGARPGQTDIMLVFATMWGGDDASQVRDLDFIAAARTALPALLSALSRAEQERDTARAERDALADTSFDGAECLTVGRVREILDNTAAERRANNERVKTAESTAAAKIAAICSALSASEAEVKRLAGRLEKATEFRVGATRVERERGTLNPECAGWWAYTHASEPAERFDTIDAAWAAAERAAAEAGAQEGGAK